ncbi:MAG: two pore domain potassium channel family protein [Deltaproteobacteria bacterium]|nr:two pore domain potassium channel family protein [Deltaproteobacteria bacterium]
MAFFEPHTRPLLSQRAFARRLASFLLVGALIDLAIVLAGALGFRLTGGLGWLDAIVDAAMTITGNGPRHPVATAAGKVFISLYALAGGTGYIIVVAIVLAPALHRLLHVFHVRAPEDT